MVHLKNVSVTFSSEDDGVGFQIRGGSQPGLPSFCWCSGASGKFPPWLNPPQCPISGLLFSVQLDKAVNSAVPSAPQARPLFPVCVYLFSLHGLHNVAGTQKTTEAQSRIARGSESAKKAFNPELSTALRHCVAQAVCIIFPLIPHTILRFVFLLIRP